MLLVPAGIYAVYPIVCNSLFHPFLLSNTPDNPKTTLFFAILWVLDSQGYPCRRARNVQNVSLRLFVCNTICTPYLFILYL